MNPILSTAPLGMHWPALDPFVFCAHHDDAYPAGNAQHADERVEERA